MRQTKAQLLENIRVRDEAAEVLAKSYADAITAEQQAHAETRRQLETQRQVAVEALDAERGLRRDRDRRIAETADALNAMEFRVWRWSRLAGLALLLGMILGGSLVHALHPSCCPELQADATAARALPGDATRVGP